ncbi:MAG: GNAT family N-acetyltransferase [Lachnospiraceae bacterium]
MIETRRLILRPFREEDAQDLYECLHQPMVHCFQSLRLNSLSKAREEAARKAEDPAYTLAIALKDTGKVIGELTAEPEDDAMLSADGVPDTFSPCWLLNRDYVHQGYAFEAAKAFLDYIFTERGSTQDLCLCRG